MLSFAELERKGARIPEVVKKLYNDITPTDNLDAITSKSGLTPENCKNALRFLTDVEAAVRRSQRVPPPPGGYKAIKLLKHVAKEGETTSSIGYTLSHNKRKIVLLVVGVTIGAVTGGLGLVVLAGTTLGTYAAGVAWRRWGHIVLRRKGNMDFDPNNREDYAAIETHIETWQDRIVKRQLDGILQKMHFQQQCWNAMNVDLLYSGRTPYSSCGDWVHALEAVCRVRTVTEEVHTGFKDIIHFWGLLTYEMVDRQEKFGARLPQILGVINGQVQKSGHTCVYGTSWFGDSSTSRKLSGGICYEWKPVNGFVHHGGPIYPKHTINTGVAWEVRLRSDRTSAFMKLMQDATTWGGLIESAYTGGNSQLPGRFRTRMARSVDMFSGGKPDRSDDIQSLYPMLFTKTGDKWTLNGSTVPPTSTVPMTGTTPTPATSGDIALTSLTETATATAITGLGRTLGGLGTGLATSGNLGQSLATSFNPAAVTTPTNLFGNVVGSSASNAVTSGAGYATAGLGIILEVLNFADNSSLVNRGRHLIGTDATVSELVTAHAGVLKDHFAAIAWAWKAFRKADDALMGLAAVSNCTEAFTAAANLLRREMYFRELVRLYQTLYTFVCLVGSTHGGIVQMMEDGNPEIIDKLNTFLSGHSSTASSGAVEEVCQGYCYRPMTEALATLHHVTAPQTVIGTPVRPIVVGGSTTTINR
jgi:hypothetical protein